MLRCDIPVVYKLQCRKEWRAVINITNIYLNSVGRKAITTCFGPQLAIVRLYTLKRILNTMCKYLDVEISYILTLFVYRWRQYWAWFERIGCCRLVDAGSKLARGNNAATKGANLTQHPPTNHNVQSARIKLNTVSICAQIMLRYRRSLHLNTCVLY